MAAQSTCHVPNCKSPIFLGSSIVQCAAHLYELQPTAFQAAVQQAPDIDLSDVVISASLLDRVLSLCMTTGTRTVIKPLLFDKAEFEDDAVLAGLTFTQPVSFDGATFRKELAIFRTSFTSSCSFSNATFHGSVSFMNKVNAAFDGATFKAGAWFVGSEFVSGANFLDAIFEGEAAFGGATFKTVTREDGEEDSIIFERAVFKGPAQFHLTDFDAKTIFTRARFEKPADFNDALFRKDAVFESASFESDVDMKFVTCGKAFRATNAKFRGAATLEFISVRELILRDADFGDKAIIRATARAVQARSCRFRKGGNIGIRHAMIDCDECRFEGASAVFKASTVDESRPLPGGNHAKIASRQPFVEKKVVERWAQEASTDEERQMFRSDEASPRLLSLGGADVSGLHIAETVDLTVCRFVNAHNLEKIRFEGKPQFSDAPKRRSRRMVIVEEQLLRRHSGRPRSGDWKVGAGVQAQLEVPSARHVQSVYRSLRKGLEDSADQPGAGDFYYGEMEMRRWTLRHEGQADGALHKRAWRWICRSVFIGGTRIVLYLYWLLSGYALRAFRAFVGLFALLAIGAFGLMHTGYVSADPHFTITRTIFGVPYYSAVQAPDGPGYWTSVSYAVQTVVLRNPDIDLTTAGRWIIIATRVLGTTLLGLALFSIRGRVKR